MIQGRIDHAAVLKRIQAKLKKRFPIRCRVRMTAEAAKKWPKYACVTGTVVRHRYSGTSPSVLWDGRKTETGYHPDFLRRFGSRSKS